MADKAAGETEKDVMKTLRAVVKGLTFPSESDKPVKAVSWEEGGKSVDEATLRTAAKIPADATVEILTPADFFAPVTKDEDWFGDEEKAQAERFRTVQAELEKSLTDTKAFRVSGAKEDTSRVDAYVLGRTPDGVLAGVQTQLIET